jgi:hypothetical protein
VIDGYPSNFEVDRNGKQREWEATSLIPFLDEDTLQASAKAIDNEMLSPIEAKRNSHGGATTFRPTGVVPAGAAAAQPREPREAAGAKAAKPRPGAPRVIKGLQT